MLAVRAKCAASRSIASGMPTDTHRQVDHHLRFARRSGARWMSSRRQQSRPGQCRPTNTSRSAIVQFTHDGTCPRKPFPPVTSTRLLCQGFAVGPIRKGDLSHCSCLSLPYVGNQANLPSFKCDDVMAGELCTVMASNVMFTPHIHHHPPRAQELVLFSIFSHSSADRAKSTARDAAHEARRRYTLAGAPR